MDKAAYFLDSIKNAKGSYILVYYYHRSVLNIVPQRRGPGIRNVSINLEHDMPRDIDKYTFIVTAFKYGKCKYLSLVKGGQTFAITKDDLYRLRSLFRDKKEDLIKKLVERAVERDKFINSTLINYDLWDIKNLYNDISREIYYLFRYFSDEQLKHISRSMLGTSKNFNNDVVKTQQIIKRIVNYTDQIGETVELIENFEKKYEEKNGRYLVTRLTGNVNFCDVLNFVEAARKGSEDYYKNATNSEDNTFFYVSQ